MKAIKIQSSKIIHLKILLQSELSSPATAKTWCTIFFFLNTFTVEGSWVPHPYIPQSDEYTAWPCPKVALQKSKKQE